MIRVATRRNVLISTASAGLAWAGTLILQPSGVRFRPQRPVSASANLPELAVPKLSTLEPKEFRTLSALCERIYPRDDTPGAVDLGVPEYVDAALAAVPPPAWAAGFREAMEQFASASIEGFGLPFWAAGPVQQDALIAHWVSDAGGQKSLFIRHALEATLEGAFSDPVHGGNRGGAGWAAFGFAMDSFSPTSRRESGVQAAGAALHAVIQANTP